MFDNTHEKVNRPKHYVESRNHEPIDVIVDWDLDFLLGNVVKYISRYGRKGSSEDYIEDLEKAQFYLRRKIEDLKKEV